MPLLALKSGRDIAAMEVDTNIQRYKSGNADASDVVEAINKSTTALIIFRMNGQRPFGVAGVPEIQQLVQNRYTLIKKYRTANGEQFLLFQRK